MNFRPSVGNFEGGTSLIVGSVFCTGFASRSLWIFQSLQQLVKLIDDAGTQVHSKNIKIRPPVRIPTPYGGRLVWTLPGKTKIVCHLKDKSKIRHKKRWSQCMYMYYLLGYKLMELPISDARKQARAENTYLLALDGDVDFQPEAVTRYKTIFNLRN